MMWLVTLTHAHDATRLGLDGDGTDMGSLPVHAHLLVDAIRSRIYMTWCFWWRTFFFPVEIT